MIEQDILNAMLQTGILAITIPVVLIVAWKMYSKTSLVPFFVGMMVFIVFSRVLEMLPHAVFLMMDNPLSRFINGHAVVYALYGGLMAGLFEEIGRFFAFRFLLAKYPQKETAVTYGIGHGGIECILVLGVTYIQYYVYGQLINSGSMDKMIAAYKDDATSVAALNQLVDNIKGTSRFVCYLADWERISAMMIHIGLSILVFQAVRVAGKRYMLWVAVVLHTMMDIPAALYQKGVLGLVVCEVIIFLFAAAVLAYSVYVYTRMEAGAVFTEQEAVREQKHRLHQIAQGKYTEKKEDSAEKEQ
jgi:uncharacterized membrane protein YhfC